MDGEAWVDSNADGDADPGEIVPYIVIVDNTGTVSLTDVNMSDDLLGDEAVCDVSSGLLSPGENMTCTGMYGVSACHIANVVRIVPWMFHCVFERYPTREL